MWPVIRYGASLSRDLSSAIVSAAFSASEPPKHRESVVVGDRNCDKLSVHKKGERNTSVYAYICFRTNTSYNSYGAVTRGTATRENVIGKRERVSLDDGARRGRLCYLHPKDIYIYYIYTSRPTYLGASSLVAT